MDNNLPETKEIMVDKDRFDAVLRKIISTKPLQLKEVIGTSNPSYPSSCPTCSGSCGSSDGRRLLKRSRDGTARPRRRVCDGAGP